jgi:exo-1,4-beta-D-glucosaminidase
MRRAIYTHSARWMAAGVSAMTLVWLASSAQAAPLAATSADRGTASAATAAMHLASSADTGASDISNLGGRGWKVQSSATTTQTGAQISAPGFNTSGWLSVTNDDAGAPGTEIEALAQNGLCPGDTALQPVTQGTSGPNSVFFSNNMQLCYGSMTKIGPDTVSRFSVPWWWRADFTSNLQAGQLAP